MLRRLLGSSKDSLCAGRGAVLPPPSGLGPGRAGAVLPPSGPGPGPGAEPGAALPFAAAMAEGSEKVPIARAGPEDVEQCLPPVSAAGRHRARRDGTGGKGMGRLVGTGWDGLDRGKTGRVKADQDGSGAN